MTLESLIDVQKRVLQNKINKGFNTTDLNKEFCLLYGEVAEAYDAWRKEKLDFGAELADIAIYLLGIAEITKTDLGAEILNKLSIIEKREYKVLKNGSYVKVEDGEENVCGDDAEEPKYSSPEMRDYFMDGMK